MKCSNIVEVVLLSNFRWTDKTFCVPKWGHSFIQKRQLFICWRLGFHEVSFVTLSVCCSGLPQYPPQILSPCTLAFIKSFWITFSSNHISHECIFGCKDGLPTQRAFQIATTCWRAWWTYAVKPFDIMGLYSCQYYDKENTIPSNPRTVQVELQ